MASKPRWDDVLTWRGFKFTRRAIQSLRWVEGKSGVRINPAQGSFNKGVSASGGTHDQEAIDCRVGGLSPAEIERLVLTLRKAGWAAWYRRAVPGLWGAHVHAVPTTGKLSPQAAYQVRAYDAGRDGLAGNRIDPTWRPKIKRRWSYALNKPVPRV